MEVFSHHYFDGTVKPLRYTASLKRNLMTLSAPQEYQTIPTPVLLVLLVPLTPQYLNKSISVFKRYCFCYIHVAIGEMELVYISVLGPNLVLSKYGKHVILSIVSYNYTLEICKVCCSTICGRLCNILN